MLYTLALFAAVTAAAPGLEIAEPEPVTRSAQLLRALDQADFDFASVQKDLGLVGAAPLVGLKPDQATVRTSHSRSAKPRVQKVRTLTRR